MRATAPQKTAPFLLERYQPGNENEILVLFDEVFRTKRSGAHWEWQFKQNPFGPPQAILAREPGTGKLVGQYTVMPVKLNVMGKPELASQSLDTMVHPDFRMFGIFESSARECFQKLTEQKHSLVFGFPNRNSYPGFMRKLGWSRVTYLRSYNLRLSLKFTLTKILKVAPLVAVFNGMYRLARLATLIVRKFIQGRNFRGHVLKSDATVPKGYAGLWEKVRSTEVLSLWKDAEYFKWRYDENPAHDFKYFFLEHEGRVVACSVVVVSQNNWNILELVVENTNASLARFLVSSIAVQAAKARANLLSFSGSSQDFFDEAFKGFSREVNFSSVFCLLPFNTTIHSVATNPNNWTVTFGDTDAY